MTEADHICGNEDIYYPPLTKLEHAMPAYALANSYRDRKSVVEGKRGDLGGRRSLNTRCLSGWSSDVCSSDLPHLRQRGHLLSAVDQAGPRHARLRAGEFLSGRWPRRYLERAIDRKSVV